MSTTKHYQDEGMCQTCELGQCTAKAGCVAISNPAPKQEPVAEPHKGEPVAVLFQDGSIVKMVDLEFMPEKSGQRVQMLYTKPYVPTGRQQRTAAEGEDTRRAWVGLTDEERFEVADHSDCFEDVVDAVEAKLREKNSL